MEDWGDRIGEVLNAEGVVRTGEGSKKTGELDKEEDLDEESSLEDLSEENLSQGDLLERMLLGRMEGLSEENLSQGDLLERMLLGRISPSKGLHARVRKLEEPALCWQARKRKEPELLFGGFLSESWGMGARAGGVGGVG